VHALRERPPTLLVADAALVVLRVAADVPIRGGVLSLAASTLPGAAHFIVEEELLLLAERDRRGFRLQVADLGLARTYAHGSLTPLRSSGVRISLLVALWNRLGLHDVGLQLSGLKWLAGAGAGRVREDDAVAFLALPDLPRLGADGEQREGDGSGDAELVHLVVPGFVFGDDSGRRVTGGGRYRCRFPHANRSAFTILTTTPHFPFGGRRAGTIPREHTRVAQAVGAVWLPYAKNIQPDGTTGQVRRVVNPEQRAREEIDRLLTAAGWVVQGMADVNLGAAAGVAIREFPLNNGHGFADYLLYFDGKACGVIEAKKQGATLTGVEVQSARYAQRLPAWR
jgi:hypothetical protein